MALGLLYTHRIIQITNKHVRHYNFVYPTEPHIHTRSSSRNAECCQPWRSVNAFLVFLTTPRYFQYLTMSSLPGQSSWVGVTMTAIGNCETGIKNKRTGEASPVSRSPRVHLVRAVIAVSKSALLLDPWTVALKTTFGTTSSGRTAGHLSRRVEGLERLGADTTYIDKNPPYQCVLHKSKSHCQGRLSPRVRCPGRIVLVSILKGGLVVMAWLVSYCAKNHC